jgi:hypothetical protein
MHRAGSSVVPDGIEKRQLTKATVLSGAWIVAGLPSHAIFLVTSDEPSLARMDARETTLKLRT